MKSDFLYFEIKRHLFSIHFFFFFTVRENFLNSFCLSSPKAFL